MIKASKKINLKKGLAILAMIFGSFSSFAQDDLMKMLDEEEEKKKDFATATFKTTRLVNGHTVENAASGVLDFRISHRFGFVNQGAYQFFGLDQATMRMSLEYGINDRLMVGFGRSTFQKQLDAFYKLKLLRQSTGGKWNSPVSVSLTSSIMSNGLKWADTSRKNYFSSRLSFSHQLLIARKFNESLSLQLMPTMVHTNLSPADKISNDVYALGMGGRIKLSKRVSFNAEYYYVLPIAFFENEDYRLPGTKNSLAIGFDIETGGHVFQLHFTNSTGMTEKTFITETTGDFFKGDIHFGFNISRVFTIKDKRKK